jgi:hypothetical protein
MIMVATLARIPHKDLSSKAGSWVRPEVPVREVTLWRWKVGAKAMLI